VSALSRRWQAHRGSRFQDPQVTAVGAGTQLPTARKLWPGLVPNQ